MVDEHFRTPALMPELTARTSATNHFNRPFQALSKKRFYSGRYRAQKIRDILVQWAV